MADNVAITAGSGTSIATDDTGAGGHVQIFKQAYSADGVATLIGADANGLDVDVVREPATVVSTANSTTANLAGAAAFTGTSEDFKDYAAATITIFSSHASATNGLSLQQSSNGTNWDITDTFTITAATGMAYTVQPAAQYFRLVYTNGATLTTSLRIQTLFHHRLAKASTQRPSDARSNEIDTEETSSFNMVFNGTTWDRAPGTTTGTYAQGPTAEDNALAGNPIRSGLRAHTGVPTAVSADNDVVTAWGDRSGAQTVIPQPRQVDLQGIPTLGTTPDYVSGDYMGTVITFTGAALATGRSGQVVSAVVLDRANQQVPLTLLLFRASPTVTSADNAALSITAANTSTARFLGSIKFAAGDYVGATSAAMCPGELVRGPISFVTSGTANIFGVLVAGGTYNAAAAGDIEINLFINQF
jgi:hypothetical protein